MGSRILVVDDEKMIRWSLGQALESAGYTVDQAADGAEAIETLGREVPDLVLLDFKLPDRSGIEVLKSAKKIAPRIPVVMITAHASVGGAVEAMKEGAYDYISKPFEIEEMIQTVKRALEAGNLREEVARQREESRKNFGVNNIIAKSSAMKEVVRLIQRVAASEASTLLLLGESGVGKGLVARALHFEGAHWEKPFMNITCTALAENLLESELFGHEKGSFTDAKAQKKGLFELADGGTVFLDEIGDLSPGLQGKLLRVLEDKTFRRVGGTRDIKVSVRIITATNKNLAKEVEAGRFRSDLYFRLKVIPIEIPALKDRLEDILPLAESFVQNFNSDFKKFVRGMDSEAQKLLREYPWPGNVRELRNAIERAVLLTEGETLVVQDLPGEIRGAAGSQTPAPISGSFKLPPRGIVLDDVEREFVQQALERARGNRTRAARLLGINRDQMRYRIEKFQLADEDSEDEGVEGSNKNPKL